MLGVAAVIALTLGDSSDIGVAVRATDSGLACPHWPGCFEGQFLPGLDAGFQVWIEWIHRTVAAVIGFLILGMAIFAFLDHRGQRAILLPSIAAVILVGASRMEADEHDALQVVAGAALGATSVGLGVYRSPGGALGLSYTFPF